MNHYDCDAIRDLLPALVRGELLPYDTASAEQHLDGCATCRAEAGIVRLLQESLAPVPAGLEARVIGAVRRRSSRRWTPVRLAMAATLAAAVLGGSVVFDRMTSRDTAEVGSDPYVLSWAAAEDPLLHGGSELQQLSEEELEVLLIELDR
jgi:predicted anti-sigma-YlaC factor YlaD